MRPIPAAMFATKTLASKSAEKRHRQSEKRRIRNKARKSEIKTRMKKVFKALGGFEGKPPSTVTDLDPVKPLIQEAFRAIDKAVQKGTLHRNTGARRKSRLSRARCRILVQAGLMEPKEKPNPNKTLVEAYEAKKRARREALKRQIQEQIQAEES